MRIAEIKDKIPEQLYLALEKKGLTELRPPQVLSIKAGLLEGKNLVVASPTASGKTLVAEIACIKNVLEKCGKAIYLTPLKALANEKYSELKESYPSLKIMISVGDFDSTDPWLEKADVIVCSNEKLDSLIRHNAPWLNQINAIIIDEIHVLDQPDRGPTLEILTTRLKEFCKNAQIIALSATIKNAKELAEWLGAELVKSDYRPVQLEYGIYLNGKLCFDKKDVKMPSAELPEHSIILDTLDKKKQVLLFLATRRNAEAAARNAKKIVFGKLSAEEKEKLEKVSDNILHALESPTKQCELVAECVKHGTAFHHAGLIAKQQRMIEEAFKVNLIKLICATPTLAYGINLPGHTVLVRDLKRYNDEFGSNWIPVLDVQQMFGRAGRPQFDREGRALMIAKTDSEKDEISERYIKGEPEEIYSKLSAEPILRMHVLGLIASGEVSSKESLFKFFSKTFYAHQYENMAEIERKLEKTLNMLIEYDFLTKAGKFILATPLGKRVAELYIDPESAHYLIEKIKEKKDSDIFWLHTICSCNEMPGLRISPKEFNKVQQDYLQYSDELGEMSPWDLNYENYVSAFKTALLIKDWISEKSEATILEEYNEAPGNLHNKIFISDWLIYSAGELARLLSVKELLLPLRKLRLRVKNGIKEELLNLIALEGVGRMRARMLYHNNIKTVGDLKKVPYETLSDLIGPKIAKKLKSQVESNQDSKV